MLRIATAQTRPRPCSLIPSIPIFASVHNTPSSSAGLKMSPAPVRSVPIPKESVLSPSYKSAYFIDAFAVTLPAHPTKPYTPASLAQAIFTEPPRWFSLLMWIRDHIMSIFGVKRSTQIEAEAAKNGIDTISIFPVISSTQHEVILGENDRHLDFRVSVLLRDIQGSASNKSDSASENQELVSVTVVHCHGLLGKIYIGIIKVFHVLIVKYNLARVPGRILAKKMD